MIFAAILIYIYIYIATGIIENNDVIDIVQFCFQGSRDNMSIVIVTFQGAPKMSDEAIKKEAELDAKIEAKIIGKGLVLYLIGL